MKSMKKTQIFVLTAMLAAVAGVLMSFEFPLPMMPPFYKIDFSDVPAIIATFLVGPVPGLFIEVVKILIKLLTVGTTHHVRGRVRQPAGHSALHPAPVGHLQAHGRDRKAGITALAVSLPIRIAFSCVLNACITLPLYAKAMGMPLNEVILAVGAVNPLIQNLPLFWCWPRCPSISSSSCSTMWWASCCTTA